MEVPTSAVTVSRSDIKRKIIIYQGDQKGTERGELREVPEKLPAPLSEDREELITPNRLHDCRDEKTIRNRVIK